MWGHVGEISLAGIITPPSILAWFSPMVVAVVTITNLRMRLIATSIVQKTWVQILSYVKVNYKQITICFQFILVLKTVNVYIFAAAFTAFRSL